MPKKLTILFAYFLIYVVWGSTYYFIGVALHGFPTFLLGALRFSTAGLILLVICACRGERVFTPRLVGRSAVSGIILLFIDMAVVMLAQRYVSSSLVAVGPPLPLSGLWHSMLRCGNIPFGANVSLPVF